MITAPEPEKKKKSKKADEEHLLPKASASKIKKAEEPKPIKKAIVPEASPVK